jgi:tetratricopeptide (TPR) repeat protein
MRAAIAIRPQSAHAIMNLGNGYEFLGQHDEAIACFRNALELNAGYSGCHNNLGVCLSRKGAYDEAVAAFEQAILLSPGRLAEAYAELSMIHSSRPETHLRNAHRAAELAAKAVEIDPNFSNHWIALGIARYREGQWPEARTALEKSLGGAIFRNGAFRWEEAIDWFFLAMCHRQLGQEEDARRAYEKAVAWIVENQPTSEQLIRFQNEAEDLLGVTAPAEILTARRERGRRHLENGEISKAVAAFSGLIGLKPEVSWYWCDRGVAYLRSGEHERAIADLTKAIELADAPIERNLRGEAYAALGQWQEAETDFSAAIELEPGSAQAWAGRASARFNLQQLDGAISDYSRAIELMPGRASEAEPLFREALRVRRQSLGEGDAATATTAFHLAQVLGTQEKFGEAETLLQDAHAALAANRDSAPAREFEPVLIQWIIKQYRAWGMPQQESSSRC